MSATAVTMKVRRQFRRSKRLGLSFPVIVRGNNVFGDAFDETTEVVSVNAHGALLVLAANVQKGQTVLVENRRTRKQEECRVAYVGSAQQGKSRVGIEFVNGPGDFWGIYFPQARASN